MTTNPLLQDSNLPHYAPHFDKFEEEHFLPAIEEAIKEARANIDAIKNNTDAPDFENTILGLETASETLGTVSSIFHNLLGILGTDNMQEIAQQIAPLLSAFGSDTNLDDDLFKRVKAVYDQKANSGLNPEQITLLEDSYKGFIRGGALLPPPPEKQRLREINERLGILKLTFNNNARKSTEDYEMVINDKNDLAGLPATALEIAYEEAKGRGYNNNHVMTISVGKSSYEMVTDDVSAFEDLPQSLIDEAKKQADKRGLNDTHIFTLDAPSFMPVLQHAENRNLRKNIWKAYNSRAWLNKFDNDDTVLEIVRLRHESANLLGHDTHAHFVLEERMAKDPQTVWNFLNKLKAAYKPAAEKDLQDLKDFAKKNDNLVDLKPWDVAFYSEKLQEERFDFSDEELRPYLALDNVLKGAFEHFSKLLNLEFTEATQYPTWHKDVKAYEVNDSKTGKFIGVFYADFHPRKGKNGGAWMTSFREQGLYKGKVERPLTMIVCNFPKPTDTTPSLLSHNDVTTLFHEMGHAVHGLLSDVTYQSLSGTNVKWDFVELPSQIQENWAYTEETLNMFAKHYQTGAAIPADLITKLNDSKNFMTGWMGLRQVGLATIDMTWHTEKNPEKIEDVATFEDDAAKDTALFPRYAGPTSNSFGHIFAGGYSAGYYSYKWAEVLDADAFAAFEKNGLYDQATADKFKAEVLSKGGTAEPNVLYHNFRGRDADPEALLSREGLFDGHQKGQTGSGGTGTSDKGAPKPSI